MTTEQVKEAITRYRDAGKRDDKEAMRQERIELWQAFIMSTARCCTDEEVHKQATMICSATCFGILWKTMCEN